MSKTFTKEWYESLNEDQRGMIRIAVSTVYSETLIDRIVENTLTAVPDAAQRLDLTPMLRETARDMVVKFMREGWDRHELLETAFAEIETDDTIEGLEGLFGKYLAEVHSPAHQLTERGMLNELDRLESEIVQQGGDKSEIDELRDRYNDITKKRYNIAFEHTLKIFPEVRREVLSEVALSQSMIIKAEKETEVRPPREGGKWN